MVNLHKWFSDPKYRDEVEREGAEVSMAYGHGFAAGRASLEPTIAAVREFAEEIIAYEDEHAPGPDTPLRLAFARDILSILDEA